MSNKLGQSQFRSDLFKIYELIPKETKVLDLGCGDGTLLNLLIKGKNVKGTGIEISQENIFKCVKNDVPVVHGNLNDGLQEFQDMAFDIVILSRTLQSVYRPDQLLTEMTRIGKTVIVSFINFGFITNRYQLMFHGKMPMTKTLPDFWYNTQNIHLGTIKDFQQLCCKLNIKITNKIPLGNKVIPLAKIWPNMFSSTCVFTLTSQ